MIDEQRPQLTDKCARCPHSFGEHYTAYAGGTGCSHVTPAGGDLRDNWPASTCGCKGFAILWQDAGSGRMGR